jgi:hypothetical protein
MMKHGRLKLLLDPTEIRNLLMTEEAISLISSQKYARNSILPADGDPQITKWAPLDARKNGENYAKSNRQELNHRARHLGRPQVKHTFWT